jgi:hypothetical protein
MPKLEQPGGSNEVTNAPGGAGSEAAERARHQQQIERGTPAPLPKGGKL